MNTIIDHRTHDQLEHGLLRAMPEPNPTIDFTPDAKTAQRIRDGLDAMREAEAFAAAQKRMERRMCDRHA